MHNLRERITLLCDITEVAKPWAGSEHCKTSKMELFVKVVYNFFS